MGQGKRFKCSSCGCEYGVFTGTGFMFPEVYKRIETAIRDGKYGEELKEAYGSLNDPAIDCDRHFYECQHCGHWTVEEGLDLYESKDENKVTKAEFVPNYVLDTDYELVRRNPHICPKCGNEMKRDDDIREVNCPECGVRNKPLEDILWD